MMTDKHSQNKKLRRKAEARLVDADLNIDKMSAEEIRSLIHELQVHQIEFEIQNEELRASQEESERFRQQYYQLYHRAPVGYVVLDGQGLIRQANATFCSLAGVNADILLGKPLETLISESDKKVFLSRYKAFFKYPEKKMMRYHFLRADGVLAVFKLEGTKVQAKEVFSHSEKNENLLLMAVSDITDQTENENHIRFQAQLLDSVGQAVIATNTDGIIIYWNKAAELLYGWRAEEADGRNIIEVTPAKTTREQSEEIMKKLSAGKPWSGELILRRKDGSVFPAFVSDYPVNNEAGELTGIVGISRDLSEEKALRAQILMEKEQKEKILESIRHGFFALDSEMKITYFNKAAEKLLGRKAKQVTGRHFSAEAFPEAAGTLFDKKFAEAVKQQKPLRFEAWFDKPPYENCYDVSVFPFNGGITVYFDVVTKRKETEARLSHLNRVLKAIRNVNQLITHEKDSKQLIAKACRELTQTRGYYNAWIVLLDESGRLAGSASRGMEKQFNVLKEKLKQGERTKCFQDALNADDLVCIENPAIDCPDCPLAELYKGKGGFSKSLRFEGRTYGVLTVSIPLVFVSDTEERELFCELADDLAFALYGIETEHELKEQGKFVNKILETTADGFWVIDAKGRMTAVNQAYCAMSGYSSDELLGKIIGEIDADESAADTAARIRRIIKNGSEIFETRHRRKNGSILHVEISVTYMKEKGGQFVCFARDLTERKQLENKNQSLLNIIKNSQDFIGVAGKGENAFFVNPAGQAMVGLDGDDVVSRTTIDEYFLEEDLPYVKETILPALFSEGRWSGEFRFRHFKTGEAIPILYDLFLTEDPETGQLTNITTISQDITERKRAEEDLQNERNQLLSVFNSIDQAIYIADTETYEILYVNRYLANLLHGNCVGVKCYQALQGLDDPCSFCTNDTILKQKPEPHRWEFHNPNFDRHYDIVDRIIRWPDGRDVRFELAVDITERKQGEEALLKSRNLLNAVQQLTKVGGWEWDAVNQMMSWTDETYRIHGMTPGQVAAGSPEHIEMSLSCYDPKDLPLVKEDFQRCLEYGEPYDREYPITKINGQRIWTRATAEPVIEDGRLVRVMGNFMDITARKQAEEALRESEEKLSALFASMTEMVVLHELVFDEAGKPVNYRITDCNSAYTHITGIRREDAVGRLANEVYGIPEPPYLEEFSRVGITGEPHHYETYFPPMDKHFSISVVSPGKNCFATITTDITEARRIQAVIDAKNKELEQLIYVASHDLRSPLVNVDGFSRELDYSLKALAAMLDSSKDTEELEKALRAEYADMEKSIGRISASALQMDGLLKGLLKLSRAGRAVQQITDIDMDRLVGQVASSFAFRMKEADIALTIENLPACRGDAVQLTQVFSNLLDNAVKYRHSERAGKIQIRGTIEMGRAVYQVEDNGIGIAENHLGHVFEIFNRLEPGKIEGEGLGLTIARQALSRMYGEIKVESQQGAGSTFIVILPRVKKKNNV